MSGPVVVTSNGAVEGTSMQGYERYLGIPYAAPPVGELRFRAPQPPARHEGVLSATALPPHAPQPVSVLEQVLSEGGPMTISEASCLALNVWTPRADATRRPVMVWIHGGAFVWGSSGSPIYDGARLVVDHDVVVVSLNYRLGATGFTFCEPAGEPFVGSGSAGVLDAVAALRWVAENAEAFGGDPGNVTIFGESAGAMSVGTLLALPDARGLFHKAILQSGAASSVLGRDEATARFTELCELAGAADVEALQALPIERLLEAQEQLSERHLGSGLAFCPVVDGVVLDRPPLEAVAAGGAAAVPLLIGTNRDEWRLFSMFDPTFQGLEESTLHDAVAQRFTGDPAMAVATYRKRPGTEAATRVLECVLTDATFRVPAVRLAEAQLAAGGAAHMYLFSWGSSAGDGGLGSCHGLELPFVFGTLDTQSGTALAGAAAPRPLAAAIGATWAAFARHGDPSGGALGPWPRYDLETRPTMVIDDDPRVELDPLGEERAMWEVGVEV